MSLAADRIASDPLFLGLLRTQSRALLQFYDADARMGSVFATQQERKRSSSPSSTPPSPTRLA